MPSVTIDNPILNSPFREPAKHFRFNDDGITNEIATIEPAALDAHAVPVLSIRLQPQRQRQGKPDQP